MMEAGHWIFPGKEDKMTRMATKTTMVKKEGSGESKWQPAGEWREKVQKRTAKNGQKQTAQKVRKRAKKYKNGEIYRARQNTNPP